MTPKQQNHHPHPHNDTAPLEGAGEVRHWNVVEVPEAEMRETSLTRAVAAIRRRFWGSVLLLIVFALVGLSGAGAADRQLSTLAPTRAPNEALGEVADAQTSAKSSADGDAALLARFIDVYGANESYRAKVAIGAVVLNRVADASFPGTIAGAIYQPNAFSRASELDPAGVVDDTTLCAARDAMNGWDPSGSALFFFDPAKRQEDALFRRTESVQIGNLLFCR